MKNLLIKLNACDPAIEWAGNKTIEEIVSTVHRGDWLLWLGKKLDLPLNKITLAKARCAKTVIHLMKDQRSINAVLIAERFGLGECTLDELRAAADAAYAAYAAAAYADASSAYDAAYDAAYAAAYAADAAYADASAAAAHADASAAATAADASSAYDAAYDAAKRTNQLQTAEICREILGQLVIEKVNAAENQTGE